MSYVLQIEQEPAGTHKWGVYDGADSGNLVCDSWCGGYRVANVAFNVGWERLQELQQAAIPKAKARRINLTNTGGDWRWEIWQEDEPGEWGKAHSHARFYASVAEAAEDAERWLRNNP